MKPTIGRIVHVNINSSEEHPEPIWRSAIITEVWGGDCVQLTVFLDAANDANANRVDASDLVNAGFASFTSCNEGTGHKQWRWPPRV